MKQGIHPTYHEDAVITCACGATYKTGSTAKELEIEICTSCHPFYTGKKKYVDTTGRVERFKKLTERAQEKRAAQIKTVKEKKLSAAKKSAPKKKEK